MNNQASSRQHSAKLPAHGGKLVNREISSEAADRIRQNTSDYRSITLDTRRLCDLKLLGIGGYSPLTGFVGEQDYQSILHNVRLSNEEVWPLPVVLPTTQSKWESIQPSEDLLLLNENEEPVGILENPEPYRRDLEEESQNVFGTTDEEHDGVRRLMNESEYLVGGEVQVFPDISLPIPGSSLAKTPSELRHKFEELGWKKVTGFQTRNPIHRAHEYLMKCALETSDGLLVHPLVGPTRAEDVPAAVRMECYNTILDHHFPEERTVLSSLPAPMWYAGPREALFHALVRQNHGCTHFIIGRDHAGVGDYYGTYEAQNFVEDYFRQDDVDITPLPFDFAFYCDECDTFASEKTCPHGDEHHLFLSGTKVRSKLRNGESLPRTFTREKVEKILQAHYSNE